VEDHRGFIIGVAAADHGRTGTEVGGATTTATTAAAALGYHASTVPTAAMVKRIVNSLYLLFKINNYILINILSY